MTSYTGDGIITSGENLSKRGFMDVDAPRMLFK